MELRLSAEEVKKALLAYANTLLPDAFNTVNAPSYHAIVGAVFSYEAPTTPELAE